MNIFDIRIQCNFLLQILYIVFVLVYGQELYIRFTLLKNEDYLKNEDNLKIDNGSDSCSS